MKPSSILCASFVALAALAVTVDGAVATTLQGTKSNADSRINPDDPKAVADCKAAGGTVTKDAAGNPVCRKPAPAPAPAPAN